MTALAGCFGDAEGLTNSGSGSDTSSTGSSTPPTAAKPTVNFQLSSSNITEGETVILQWAASGAQGCTASGGWSGTRPTSGTLSTTLSTTTTYTLTCTGTAGSETQTRQVVVTKVHAPAITLTASPTTINSAGTTTLAWTTTNAGQCFAGGGWKGLLPVNGTWTSGPLTNNTEFELTCAGPGGSASQSATVTVTSQAPQVTLQTSPSTVSSGGSSTLTWAAKDATACTASGAWSGTKGVSGSQSTGPVTVNSTYVLSCTGLGGNASQSATVSVSSAAPVVTISASPSTVTKGRSATLTWSAKNATSCTAGGGWSGTKTGSGSQSTGAVEANTVYSLSCTGPGGSAVQSATVSVKSPTPTVSLSVGPSSVSSGGSATLTWSSTNATSCSASGAWSGVKGVSGSESTGPLTAGATFGLTCTGPGGSASQSATVSVKKAAPTVALSASPSSITSGNSSTLSWSSANTTSCTASGAWSGPQSLTGSQSTGALKANASYTLACTGPGGNAVQTATVTVTAVPTATVKLSASPSTVASGASSTLTWSATNATACTASGGWSGSESLSGSTSTGALKTNTTYTISCSGAGGSASQSTTVSVSQAAPTVSISASPSTINSGASSTLTWSSTNATACTAAGAWSGSKSISGSQSTGALKANASYSLTCTGTGGSATQAATVSVTAPTPAPTVTLSASPSTVASGGASTLNWSSTNATSCAASGGWSGTMATSGSQATGALKASTTYTLVCTGTGGSATQSATVSVTSPAPTVALSVSPSTATRGTAAMLTWSSTNATSCTASQGWTGSKSMSGSQSTGNLSANQTYMLNCSGTGGSASQSATVTVTTPAPTVTLSASPTTVASGGTSTLTWSSTNATSCSASGGWGGTEGVSGSTSTAAVTATTKYTLTCTGTGGSATQSVTVSVSTPAPTVTLSAAAGSVSSGGSTMLNWSASNATSCTASGGWSGTMGTSGSQSTGGLTQSTTYTLNCTGPGGSTQQSATVAVSAPVTAGAGSCTGTSGPLALKVSTVRSSGVSPFLVFFDATATTDSSIAANMTTFQDVTYSWNFGDNNASGTGTWAYGSNAGHNSKNTATGGVAAHLYITPGVDTEYVVTVTAHDGTNTASCQLAVTAEDPAGSSGFAGAKTTCVSASGTPTPGSGDCPAGAAVLNTSSFNTALSSAYFGSGKRVLFKCGDTFSGDNATLSGTTWSVGAYGGCEGTQSGRPIFSDTGGNYQLVVSANAGDGRIADLAFNGNGTGAGAVAMPAGTAQPIPYQITLYNLQSSGNSAGYYWSQGAQWGLIGSTQLNSRGNIAVFINTNENNPTHWTGPYPNLDYQAAIGNFVNGVGSAGGSGAGIEAFRVSACRMCVFENNTIENANNVGGVFKLHNGNTNNSVATWTGVYTELIEISDNLFTGNSGGILSDIAPQNGGLDERLRNFVIERNLYSASTVAQGGMLLLLSGANMTLRDNVFDMPGPSNMIYPILGAQVAQRGSGNLLTVQYNEVYNNTCYAPNAIPSQMCIGFDTVGQKAAPTINSFAKNNLFYVPSRATGPTVDNTGSGNAVSNNTGTVTDNPGFINGSGNFSLISDFKPTANYSGGTSVPVLYDALGILWASAWDLGAVDP